VSGVFLMLVHGTDGDVLPIVRIGQSLHARGHDVTMLTHARYATRVRRAGLRFVAVDMVAAYEHSQSRIAGFLDVITGEDPDRGVRRFNDGRGFAAQFRFECQALARRHRPGRTVLVGVSTMNMSVLTAAEALGAPVVCLGLSPFYFTALPAIADGLREMFAADVAPVRARLGLAPVTDWSAWMTSADAYLGLWPRWFDRAGPPGPVAPRLTGVVLPDGEHDELPAAAGQLLAGPVRPILVAGASSLMVRPEFYRTAVDACAIIGRPTLIATPHRELVPDPLPSNVHWFPRLPFPAVMPRVAAVVHHGGIGTAWHALRAGARQVALAQGGDRPDNARRLARSGVATWLPAGEWTAEAVAALLAAAVRAGPVSRTGEAEPGEAEPGEADPVAAAADILESHCPG
jgi:rhamnosyltransferase subunit B